MPIRSCWLSRCAQVSDEARQDNLGDDCIVDTPLFRARLVVAATVLRHDEVERADSLLEGRVTSEPVSESGISGNYGPILRRLWMIPEA